MANTDAPFGLRPIRHKSGAPYNGACKAYFVTGSNSALFIGDPVIKAGSSNSTAINGHLPGSLPTVVKATAGDGNAITGVIVGFETTDRSDTPYRVDATDRVVLVADDPDLVFVVQDDGGGALDHDAVGLNANLIFTTAGNTATGISGVELDGGTTDGPAADASNQLTIQRLHPVVGNELADFAIWEVTINQHTEALGALGI